MKRGKEVEGFQHQVEIPEVLRLLVTSRGSPAQLDAKPLSTKLRSQD